MVRVPATNLPVFRGWLLGMLDHAEVLEPAEVRAARALVAGRHRGGGRMSGTTRGPDPVHVRLHLLLVVLPWLAEHGETTVAEVASVASA